MSKVVRKKYIPASTIWLRICEWICYKHTTSVLYSVFNGYTDTSSLGALNTGNTVGLEETRYWASDWRKRVLAMAYEPIAAQSHYKLCTEEVGEDGFSAHFVISDKITSFPRQLAPLNCSRFSLLIKYQKTQEPMGLLLLNSIFPVHATSSEEHHKYLQHCG